MFKRKNPFIMRFTEETEGAGAPPNPGDGKPSDDGESLGEGGIKALRAEREARSAAEKRAKDAEDRIKAFEDEKKTDAEKQADRISELEATANASVLTATRYEVAAEAGLPLSAAKRLSGSTREELLSDAEELKKLLVPAAPNNPRPDPSQGGGDDSKPGGIQAGRDLFRDRHKKTNH